MRTAKKHVNVSPEKLGFLMSAMYLCLNGCIRSMMAKDADYLVDVHCLCPPYLGAPHCIGILGQKLFSYRGCALDFKCMSLELSSIDLIIILE
jgi:hypothetical protein